MIDTNHMEPLDGLDLEQASGGIPAVVIVGAAFMAGASAGALAKKLYNAYKAATEE